MYFTLLHFTYLQCNKNIMVTITNFSKLKKRYRFEHCGLPYKSNLSSKPHFLRVVQTVSTHILTTTDQ